MTYENFVPLDREKSRRGKIRLDLRVFTREYLCVHLMPRATTKRGRTVPEGRSGKPQTIWFTDQQAEALESLSGNRKVTKTTLVRFAVDEMLKGFYAGQLKLPGID